MMRKAAGASAGWRWAKVPEGEVLEPTKPAEPELNVTELPPTGRCARRLPTCGLALGEKVVLKNQMPSEAFVSTDSPPRDEKTAQAPSPDRLRWVPETRFGRWFLGTNIWTRYVVEVALRDLVKLLPPAARHPKRIVDAGSGPGVSLPLLDRHFSPELIIGLDINPAEVLRSAAQAKHCRARVEVRRGDANALDLPDGSVDLVLCHQLLHHVVRQEIVLSEMYRVLAPGGTLLVSESCRDFILSTPVRLLFRHPNEVQRTAAEYQQLVRNAGFTFGPEQVKTSTPFWSLPDWGLRQKLGWRRPVNAEPTEVMLVAFKPAQRLSP